MTEPQSLTSMIAVQPGAVVSLTVLKKPAGTVTLFAFDEGQGLSEHTAPFDAIVQAIEGTCDVTIGTTPHQLKAGEVLLLPANVPHAVQATSAFKMLLTMIRA